MGKCETMRRLGWGENSFSTKCASYPEVGRAYFEGRGEILGKIRDVGVQVALEGDPGMIKWFMERLAPEDYGKQTSIKAEVNSKVEASVKVEEQELDIENMSDKQREALRTLVGHSED
jgi:hypothetical protein